MGTSQIDQGLAAGQFGSIIVIRNYNGMRDDPQVTVEYYVSNGLNRDADGGIPVPRFDGTDLWTTDPGSVQGGQAGGGAVYADPEAYVTANQVVAHMSMPIPIQFGDRTFLGGAKMLLSGAVIVGTLVSADIGDSGALGLALQGGTIAGRWPTSQILATLATIPEDGGTFLCGTEQVISYGFIKAGICANADISASGQDNRTPTLAPCDAISVGMQFTAVPAQLGDVLAVPLPPSGCKSDSGVAWSDTCPQ
jgi:hypothetical protein